MYVATVVRCVTSGSDTSGFVQMSRESPRESHVRTGRVFSFEFFAVYRQTVLKRAFARFVHLFFLFFEIIKGSAYGSYSLRTVFASIVLGSLVLRSVWSSFVESIGLFRSQGELFFVFGSICAITGLFRSQGRTLLRVWIDLCDY